MCVRKEAIVGASPAPRGGERPHRDPGSSMVEVVVAIVLLAIFSIAAVTTVINAKNTTADNRNRVTAIGLADRELAFAKETITRTLDGAATLVAKTPEQANPHPLDGGEEGQPYIVDGVRYTVTVRAEHLEVGTGSPCETGKAAGGGNSIDDSLLATRVSAEVTWDGNRAPVLTEKLFAPRAGQGNGLPDGTALITVQVSGFAKGGAIRTPAANVPVTVVIAGGSTKSGTTDSRGCLALETAPPAAGESYAITLNDADPDNGRVTSQGETQPVRDVDWLEPGKVGQVTFTDYSAAGSVRVTVDGWTPNYPGKYVSMSLDGQPLKPVQAEIKGRVALFENVPPGTHTLWVGAASNSVSLTLAAGANVDTRLEVSP